MQKLIKDAKNINKANDLFTKCLMAIEKDQKQEAAALIKACYHTTDSIEQRLALCFLSEMLKKTKQDNITILENVYNL